MVLHELPALNYTNQANHLLNQPGLHGVNLC